MFSRSFALGRPFGIAINIHWTWSILAFLVAFSLATTWLPGLVPGLKEAAYWSAALVCTIGLFTSIVVHEFCHALVGRHYQMPIEKITLFLFGGVAHLESEPPSPKAEFLMAIAGPAVSVVLAFLFYGFFVASLSLDAPPLVPATLSYLASINVVVAVFNMLPGYPLDGGRVLRAALWRLKGDVIWATRLAAASGQFFGLLFFFWGLATIIAGRSVGGIWPMLLGSLMITLARSSYTQLVVKHTLHGRPAASFMNTAPVCLSPQTPVSDFIRESEEHSDQLLYPVVSQDQRFIGCANPSDAKQIPSDEWSRHLVSEITHACEADHAIDPDTDAEAALEQMARSGYRELLVVRGHQVLGILTQQNLMRSIRSNV